jgi:hypothetical protein
LPFGSNWLENVGLALSTLPSDIAFKGSPWHRPADTIQGLKLLVASVDEYDTNASFAKFTAIEPFQSAEELLE